MEINSSGNELYFKVSKLTHYFELKIVGKFKISRGTLRSKRQYSRCVSEHNRRLLFSGENPFLSYEVQLLHLISNANLAQGTNPIVCEQKFLEFGQKVRTAFTAVLLFFVSNALAWNEIDDGFKIISKSAFEEKIKIEFVSEY